MSWGSSSRADCFPMRPAPLDSIERQALSTHPRDTSGTRRSGRGANQGWPAGARNLLIAGTCVPVTTRKFMRTEVEMNDEQSKRLADAADALLQASDAIEEAREAAGDKRFESEFERERVAALQQL